MAGRGAGPVLGDGERGGASRIRSLRENSAPGVAGTKGRRPACSFAGAMVRSGRASRYDGAPADAVVAGMGAAAFR